jgi:hypothetical protein
MSRGGKPMSRSTYVSAFIVYLALQSRLGFSQTTPLPLPVLRGASVDTVIVFDPKTGVFNYSYTVRNSTGSTGEINIFEVDITTTAGALPSAGGLESSATGYLAVISGSVKATLGDTILPVGIVDSPSNWDSGINSNGGDVKSPGVNSTEHGRI